jgi:hypothetical protein
VFRIFKCHHFLDLFDSFQHDLFPDTLQTPFSNLKMKFISFAAIAATLFFNGAYACKCLDGKENITRTTERCCLEQNGNYVNGGDCAANSISESLSNFASCCASDGYDSDCDCPSGCFAEGDQRSNVAAIKTGMISEDKPQG